MYQLGKPREACGICGIYAPGADVARLAFFALYALQHRGQESAGIATSDGVVAHVHKGMGLVSQVFNEENLRHLQGYLSIGHTRYSTTGSSYLRNAQRSILRWRRRPTTPVRWRTTSTRSTKPACWATRIFASTT